MWISCMWSESVKLDSVFHACALKKSYVYFRSKSEERYLVRRGILAQERSDLIWLRSNVRKSSSATHRPQTENRLKKLVRILTRTAWICKFCTWSRKTIQVLIAAYRPYLLVWPVCYSCSMHASASQTARARGCDGSAHMRARSQAIHAAIHAWLISYYE